MGKRDVSGGANVLSFPAQGADEVDRVPLVVVRNQSTAVEWTKVAYLSRQVRLPVRRHHVLNDAVTEHEIKRAILDAIDIARIAFEIPNIAVGFGGL